MGTKWTIKFTQKDKRCSSRVIHEDILVQLRNRQANGEFLEKGIQNVDLRLENDDLGYAGNLAWLFEPAEHAQHALDRFSLAAILFDMCSALSKRKNLR